MADASRREDGSDIPLGEMCREAADALEAAQARIEAVRRETPTQHILNARIAEHRKAVEWLHSRAKAMNDPHAKQILNSAALAYGVSRALTEAKEDRT